MAVLCGSDMILYRLIKLFKLPKMLSYILPVLVLIYTFTLDFSHLRILGICIGFGYLFHCLEDFFADSQENMKHDIYEEDYPMMAEAMKKENLLSKLEEVGKVFLNYRLVLDGRHQYVSLVAVNSADDKDHIIVAVENIDAEKRSNSRLLSDQLSTWPTRTP